MGMSGGFFLAQAKRLSASGHPSQNSHLLEQNTGANVRPLNRLLDFTAIL